MKLIQPSRDFATAFLLSLPLMLSAGILGGLWSESGDFYSRFRLRLITETPR